jgi:hypothetical protein
MHERSQIKLNALDRTELEAVVANRNSPQKHVWRAKIVLLQPMGTAPPRSCGGPERPRQSSGAGKNSLAPKSSPDCGATKRDRRAFRPFLLELNAVEGVFALLTKRLRSVEKLKGAIHDFIADTNANLQPFAWTRDLDKIIVAIKRGHQALDSIH